MAPRFNAPEFFAHKDRVARFSMAALIVSSVVSLVSLCLVARLATQSPVVLGVDRAGIPFGDRGTSFAQAKELHIEQALLATTALLSRTSNEFDLPEILEALYSASALQAAKSLKASEAAEFQSKNLSQKAHPVRIEALETRPDTVLVLVTGKVARRGVFEQEPFDELLPFNLRLTLRLNTDILRNRRYPTIVTEFHLTYAP